MSVKVAAIKEQAFAGLIVSQLREVGLNPFDISFAEHVSLAGADQFYYISVVDEEVEQAKEALIDLGYQEYLMSKNR